MADGVLKESFETIDKVLVATQKQIFLLIKRLFCVVWEVLLLGICWAKSIFSY